jgi:uncharacterized cupredoxin-like copper-binding protein
VLAALAAAAVGIAGCRNDHAQQGGGRVVGISEKDFAIKAPLTVRAGVVDLAVKNRGPDAHELIVIRSQTGKLPLRTDGTTVDEESLEARDAVPGALEPGEPGGVRHLRVRLRPGLYELICNMAGHYHGGMHTTLAVS